MLSASTIVAIVLDLHADGQTPDQIADTLTVMGFGNGTAAEPEPEAQTTNDHADTAMTQAPAPKPASRRFGGAAPMVKYQMVGTWTPAKLAQRLTGRKLEVASIVLAHNKTGITKRDILAKLQAQDPNVTDGAVMSALAPLGSVMGIVKSVPIPGAARPAFGKPAATGRGARVR